MERLRIPLEFNKNKKEEVELYNTLQKYSNPSAYIKDVLRGLVPIPGIFEFKNSFDSKNFNSSEDDNEDLLDI